MSVHSAALLPYRTDGGTIQVFIAHMGGPFWASKDDGAWSVAKGEFDPSEEPAEAAARREFEEEIGVRWTGTPRFLGEFRQPSGKVVHVFVAPADAGLTFRGSNHFEMEWPRGSGRIQTFPEIDAAGWFTVDEAQRKLVAGQRPVLDALVAALAT